MQNWIAGCPDRHPPDLGRLGDALFGGVSGPHFDPLAHLELTLMRNCAMQGGAVYQQ